MNHITFISTIHKEIGKCNTKELFKIIDKLNPEVIFLEAIDETYSDYEHWIFSNFGVFHEKLEISAIQNYHYHSTFQYVPVCVNGLSEAFHKKVNLVCKNRELQKLIDNFNYLAAENGFEFLNSLECINLQEEMRELESRILNNDEMDKIIRADIEAYENPMIQNINSYCKKNHFNSGIFMCGAAHRKSIIEKIDKSMVTEEENISWTIFGN
ncbi:hypothetical protein J0X14_17220 [Muricauda sp. CAU 1633]|uniref:hypothetical protein n=1 Tax=Allomuricauda sp. CAU 1633 TaxID=2816036 RepID=UPI001A8FA22E|nr:hypothetical protein [Muricauda sp. CAU 1633]MBO0324053.1 hypothetical protein [Muricauda sp. CAU 1633]